jgi:hypothetical protein
MRTLDVAIEGLIFAADPDADPRPCPSAKQIAQAEKTLGMILPPSFKEFMDRCGFYRLPQWDTCWIGNGRDDGYQDLIVANLRERKHPDTPLPARLIVFAFDDVGDPYCFDTADPDEHGEYPVLLFDHELTAEQNLQSPTYVAVDFAHWLKHEVHEKG